MKTNESIGANSEPKILVDFDSTLFDNDAFKGDLYSMIGENTGTPAEQVMLESREFYADSQLGGYDFEAHVTSHELDPEHMWDELDVMMRNGHYLFPRSIDFMQALHSDGYNPGILSFGTKRFQLSKIQPYIHELSDPSADRDLDVEIVLDRKAHYIETEYPGEKGVLVDDVDEQKLPDGFVEIHLNNGSNILVPQLVSPAVYTVASLEQALDVIRTEFPRSK